MATNKTPLYQTEYKFTAGKHIGSTLSTSEKGDLTFRKNGNIIRLDPNSSSAKYLLKQQKHEERVAHARQMIKDSEARKLVQARQDAGGEEYFEDEGNTRVLKQDF